MDAWGKTPPANIFAVVTITPPPSNDVKFRLLLISRVMDSTVDRMEDTQIEKSGLRSFVGQTIEMPVSLAFVEHARKIPLIEVVFAIIPVGITPNKIYKLSDVTRVGGKIAADNGFNLDD
jgi:hypothetical protein